MAKGTYSHASHIDKVLKASKARYCARVVLSELCRQSEFEKPETSVHKSTLQGVTGYTRRSVQLALQWLREEGSIVPTVPLQDFVAGRGRAMTYRLAVVGEGASQIEEPTRGGGDKDRDQRLTELLSSGRTYLEARRSLEADGFTF